MNWVPDVNVLVALATDASPRHAVAAQWLRDVVRIGQRINLLTETISGTLRVLAQPPYAVPVAEVLRVIDGWHRIPGVALGRPSHLQYDRFRELMLVPGIHPRDATDAIIAAAALDLDATLVTWDAGFSRFPTLRWQRPGDRQPVTNPR